MTLWIMFVNRIMYIYVYVHYTHYTHYEHIHLSVSVTQRYKTHA